MKQCAYCNESRKLTKEHIWPSTLIKKYSNKLLSYNKRVDAFIPGEATVKDVCPDCNNVKLSKLDAYLSELYDDFLHVLISPGDSAVIEYDYELLLRSLLKISFNVSRAGGNKKTIKAHKKFARYILDGGLHPAVQLRLQIVTPAKIVDLEKGVLTGETLPPISLRCADIAYDGQLRNKFAIRLVAINNFWFYIILSHKLETKRRWNKFIEGFSSWKINPGILIEPNTNKLDIPVELTTYMSPKLFGSLANAIYKS